METIDGSQCSLESIWEDRKISQNSIFDYKESPHSNEGIQQLKTYGKFLGTLLRIYSGTLGIRHVL